MSKVDVQGDSYRLIPSHFPPIGLFENLLDPQELEAAYALESLTNDRLQDEVGNIALVAPKDRVTGPGTTAIMAAFTHTGTESRFTKGQYGIYYAGLDLDTAIAESRFSRSRFLQVTSEGPQVLTMRCYHCVVDAALVDVCGDPKVHDPDSFVHAQAVGEQLKQQDELGILYRSIRHAKGECVALLRPKALTPPAVQAGHYQFHWDGNKITNVLSVSEYT
ncbi:MAG: RES family NAD+ phosphorylase [Gammaproteobacteria bacterium]|nr:RES family NAD+ phosphorylase [Gammaproteobacteria bacterium]MCF6363176.1 RES family NAD+ phosphorylase [Gammaproteobacteria bacterium]